MNAVVIIPDENKIDEISLYRKKMNILNKTRYLERKGKKPLYCLYCRHMGHLESRCFKKRNDSYLSNHFENQKREK